MLYGNELLNKFNNMCRSAKYRFWVVSPFLGRYNDLYKIIGDVLCRNIPDVRLITDIENIMGIDKESLIQFLNSGNVKTLNMLHAKFYVIDDKVLITSANLSKTAFQCRYEIGNIVDFNKDIEKIFNYFWYTSKDVTKKEINIKDVKYDVKSENGSRGRKIRTLWNLNNNNNNKNGIITASMIEEAYIVAKKYYQNKLTIKQGRKQLKNIGWNSRSAHTYIWDFKYMMQGKRYTQTMNKFGTEYYLKNIYKDFGNDLFKNAINAYKQHIEYNRNLIKPNRLSYAEDLIEKVKKEIYK